MSKSNILIVESKNDKFFIQALIDEIKADIQIEKPICIDEYECLGGLNPTKMTNALKALKADIQKEDIQKIGIIIDIDNFSCEERKEKKQAGRKCNLEYSMENKKYIWDFTHLCLDDLKEFLNLFAEVD